MKTNIIKSNKSKNINHDQPKEDNRNNSAKRKQNCQKAHKSVTPNKNKLLIKQTLTKSRQKELQNNPDSFIKQIQKTFQEKINQLNKKYLNKDKSIKKSKSLDKTPVKRMNISSPSHQSIIQNKNTEYEIQIQNQQKILSQENDMQYSKCTFQKQKQFYLKHSQIQSIYKTCKQQQHLISKKLQSISQVYEQNQNCIRECFTSMINDIQMIHSKITHLLQEEKQKHLTESNIQSEVYSFITMLKKIKNVHLRQNSYYQDDQHSKSSKQSNHSFVYFPTEVEMKKVLLLHEGGSKLINNVKFIQKQLQTRYDKVSQVIGEIKHFLNDISKIEPLTDCLDLESSSLPEENDFSQNNNFNNQSQNQRQGESQQQIDLDNLSFKIHSNNVDSSPSKLQNFSDTQNVKKIINQNKRKVQSTMMKWHDILNQLNNVKNLTSQHIVENQSINKETVRQQLMNHENNEQIFSESKLQQQFDSHPVTNQESKQHSELESSINNEVCLSFPFTAKNKNESSPQQSSSKMVTNEQNNNKLREESARSDLIWMKDIQCFISKDLDNIANKQQNIFTVGLAQCKSENIIASSRVNCQNNSDIHVGPVLTRSQLQITPTKSLEGNIKRSIKKCNPILKNSKHHNQNQTQQRNLNRINQDALNIPKRIINAQNQQQGTQQDHQKSTKKQRTYRKINPYLLFNSSIDQMTNRVNTHKNVFNLAIKQFHYPVIKSKSIDFIQSYKSLEQLPSHLKQIRDLGFTKEISDNKNLSAIVLPLTFNPDISFQSNSHRQFFNQLSSSRRSAKNNCYDTLRKQKFKFDKIKNCRFTTFGLQF